MQPQRPSCTFWSYWLFNIHLLTFLLQVRVARQTVPQLHRGRGSQCVHRSRHVRHTLQKKGTISIEPNEIYFTYSLKSQFTITCVASRFKAGLRETNIENTFLIVDISLADWNLLPSSQVATEKDFRDAVDKVIKSYAKFSATPKYMTYN